MRKTVRGLRYGKERRGEEGRWKGEREGRRGGLERREIGRIYNYGDGRAARDEGWDDGSYGEKRAWKGREGGLGNRRKRGDRKWNEMKGQ